MISFLQIINKFAISLVENYIVKVLVGLLQNVFIILNSNETSNCDIFKLTNWIL